MGTSGSFGLKGAKDFTISDKGFVLRGSSVGSDLGRNSGLAAESFERITLGASSIGASTVGVRRKSVRENLDPPIALRGTEEGARLSGLASTWLVGANRADCGVRMSGLRAVEGVLAFELRPRCFQSR